MDLPAAREHWPVFRRRPSVEPETPVYAEDLRNITLTLLDILEELRRVRGLLQEGDDGEEGAGDEP